MPLCGNETRSAISCQKAKRVSHPCHFQTIPFPPEANGQLPRQDDLLASVHHTPLHESTIKQAEIENVRSAVSAARRRPSRAVRCPYARVSRLPWITGTRPDVNKSPGSGIVFVRDRPEGDIILFCRHKKSKGCHRSMWEEKHIPSRSTTHDAGDVATSYRLGTCITAV